MEYIRTYRATQTIWCAESVKAETEGKCGKGLPEQGERDSKS